MPPHPQLPRTSLGCTGIPYHFSGCPSDNFCSQVSRGPSCIGFLGYTREQAEIAAGSRSILVHEKSSAGILCFSSFVQSVLENRTILKTPYGYEYRGINSGGRQGIDLV